MFVLLFPVYCICACTFVMCSLKMYLSVYYVARTCKIQARFCFMPLIYRRPPHFLLRTTPVPMSSLVMPVSSQLTCHCGAAAASDVSLRIYVYTYTCCIYIYVWCKLTQYRLRITAAPVVQFAASRTKARRLRTARLRHPITPVFTRATPSAIIYSTASIANESTYDLYSSTSKAYRPGRSTVRIYPADRAVLWRKIILRGVFRALAPAPRLGSDLFVLILKLEHQRR